MNDTFKEGIWDGMTIFNLYSDYVKRDNARTRNEEQTPPSEEETRLRNKGFALETAVEVLVAGSVLVYSALTKDNDAAMIYCGVKAGTHIGSYILNL